MGLAGQADIVGKAPFAANQLWILGAQHRLADAEFCDRPAIRRVGRIRLPPIGIASQIHEQTSSAWRAAGVPWPARTSSIGG